MVPATVFPGVVRRGIQDAPVAQPIHFLAHPLCNELARPVDFRGVPRLIGVLIADRVGVSAEDVVVVQGIDGGEDVSDGVMADVVRRPHEDWRIELLTDGDEHSGIVLGFPADLAAGCAYRAEKGIDVPFGNDALFLE